MTIESVDKLQDSKTITTGPAIERKEEEKHDSETEGATAGIEVDTTTQPVLKTLEANQEQVTKVNKELSSEQPDNIEVTTDDIIEQEAESKTAVTSDNKEENNATESYTNIDEESNNETITTEVSVEVSKT